MRRAISLLEHALAAALRRRGRNFAIAFGIALVTALAESVTMLTSALVHEYEAGAEVLPDLVVQNLVGGRPALAAPDALVALRERPGIVAIEPRVWGYLYLPSIEANVTIVATQGGAAGDARILRGRLPRARGETALGQALADSLGLRVGDTMALPVGSIWASFHVVGIFRASTAMRTADIALVAVADARRLLAMPDDRVTDLAIRVSTPSETAPIAREIRDLLPTARVLDRALATRTYALTFGARSGLFAAMLFPAIAALLLLAWDRLTGLGEEERREIAVLKLVGWSTRDVMAVRMVESGLVAFIGTSAGFTLAYVDVFVLGAPVLKDALFGWSHLVPDLVLSPTVSAFDLVTLLGTVVVPFVLVSLVPAFLAAMRDPLDGWRGS
jgi:hypothetical protein